MSALTCNDATRVHRQLHRYHTEGQAAAGYLELCRIMPLCPTFADSRRHLDSSLTSRFFPLTWECPMNICEFHKHDDYAGHCKAKRSVIHAGGMLPRGCSMNMLAARGKNIV